MKRKFELLSEELEVILAPLSIADGLYSLVKEPLSAEGRGLAPYSVQNKPWPLLPMIVSQFICGRWEQVLPVAASMQLLLTAGDVFDDIEDADSDQSIVTKFGIPTATNVGTTLLILAEKALTRLKHKEVSEQLIVSVVETVNSYFEIACLGQHLDLAGRLGERLTEEQYIKIIDMKSASQIQCACHLGAMIATDDPHLINTFSSFGHALGMAFQISNDIQGIITGKDIINKHVTLPIIFGLSQSDIEIVRLLENVYSRASHQITNTTQVKDVLFRIGAIQYAILQMQNYKEQAKDLICKVAYLGNNVDELSQFLE